MKTESKLTIYDLQLIEETAKRGDYNKSIELLIIEINRLKQMFTEAWPNDQEKCQRITPYLNLLIRVKNVINLQACMLGAMRDVNDTNTQIKALRDEIKRYKSLCKSHGIDPRQNQFY
jgi:hypothetical protein